MDEKVEFMVATPLSTFFLPVLLLSKAISIVFSSFWALWGTHSVLPLFATIWRRIFVAMLLKFFFLKVPSVAIWQIILLLTKQFSFICLYWLLSWLGMIIKQMLQPSWSAALYTYLSIAETALRLSKSPMLSFTTLRSTFNLLDVSSNKSTIWPASVLRKYTRPALMLCLLAKIGWANRLKKDYLPCSTLSSFPKANLGGGINLALKLSMFLSILIPI